MTIDRIPPMAAPTGTDFVFFIHGVNTRLGPNNPGYARNLISLLIEANDHPRLTLSLHELEWYTIMQEAEQQLLQWLNESPHWRRSWFRDFRRTQIIPFTGDAALYISRYIGSEVVKLLKEQAVEILRHSNPETDRLHLVAHSWGSVILFDIFFAGRWDNPDIPGYEDAQFIRRAIFGLEPESQQGIRVASIHTLGSPVALANLINLKRMTAHPGTKLNEKSIRTVFTHDITFGLEQLLHMLYDRHSKPLTWRNFAHVGDPVAYPLATIIPKLISVEESGKHYLDIEDVSTRGTGFLEIIASLLRRSFLALVNGGNAHQSYWRNRRVAQMIVQMIRKSA
ncbi:MAG: hypothetical protein MUF49_08000 [Oculatellaceae cyanobacterium Prado106]|jgi:hypothetical protein|nr:hypothetical protein [Oculatellaceae cyanobacterium Prado106]